MGGTSSHTSASVRVEVELFGLPRLAVGRPQVRISVPARATCGDLAQGLARECPELVGTALRPDLKGLQDGYVFNLNGTEFVGMGPLTLKLGDCLLLISNQAGG